MVLITMVDVPSKYYNVKVEKIIAMITDRTWVFDGSGTLIDNLCKQVDRLKSHEGIRLWNGGRGFDEHAGDKTDREFVDAIIDSIDDLNKSGGSINILVINAGNLFRSFSRTIWRERHSRDGWEDDDKTIKDRLNDLVAIIKDSEQVKKCFIFNRSPGDDDPLKVMWRYPESIEVLELEGVVNRIPVTDLVA